MSFAAVVEALVLGLALTVLGVVLHLISMQVYKHDMNNLGVCALHLFVFGFVLHLLFEFTGLNSWYCKNGAACKAK